MSKDYELDEKTRRKLEDDTGKINKWLKDLNITKEILDNERCPLKSSSFLKNFRQKYTSLPLVVAIFFLIISVSIFNLNYLALKIWLSFYGSIIAGFLTLFGVALTIIYNKEQIIYDNKNRDIKREIETISTMLAEIDYSFCYYVFNTFKSLKITNGTLNETLVYDLKKELEKRYSFLYKSSAFLSAYSKIVNIPLECENYKNTCATYKIKKNFLKFTFM